MPCDVRQDRLFLQQEMLEQASNRELINIIGELNGEIYDLQQKLSAKASRSPRDRSEESDVEFLEYERKAHQEANEAEIQSLKQQLDLECEKSHELQAQVEELSSLLREQQTLNQGLEMQRKESFGDTGDIDQLYSIKKALELQLRTAKDENAALVEQIQARDAKHRDEVKRLVEQFTTATQEPVNTCESAEIGKLRAELLNTRETLQVMSENLRKEINGKSELHDRLMRCQKDYKERLAKLEEDSAAYSVMFDSLKVLLNCAEPKDVVAIVQQLVHERGNAQASVDERIAIEQKMNELIFENQRLQRDVERLSASKNESDPKILARVTELEAENERLRAKESENKRAADDAQQLRYELESMKRRLQETQKQLSNAMIEGEAKKKETNEAEICSEIGKHFKTGIQEPTLLTQYIASLFEDIAGGRSCVDSLEKLEKAALSADPNETMDVLIDTMLHSVSDRLNRYQSVLDEINRKSGDLDHRVHRILSRKRDREQTERRSSIASTSSFKSSKIPTFAKGGRPRPPLMTKNQFGFEALPSRRLPTAVREPNHRTFM